MTTTNRRRSLYLGWLGALLLVAGAGRPTPAALAQEQVEPPKDLTATIDQGFAELIGRYDWESDAPNVRRALASLFEQNGWDTESDRFATQLAGELAQIPPWDPMGRINKASALIADRYGIPQAGEFRIKTRMMIDISGFFGRHADVILEQTRGFMKSRMAGKAYTAADVANWAAKNEALYEDIGAAADGMYRDIATMVDPDGLKLLDADLASFKKRRAYLDKMNKVWRAGGWKPSHWGMEDDPIQNGTHPGMIVGGPDKKALEPKNALSKKPVPRRWVPHDQRTWIAYVNDLERRCELDKAQLATIGSIHREMVARADTYVESRKEELYKVPAKDRPTADRYRPIRLLFEGMRERLNAVLTTAQREKVKT